MTVGSEIVFHPPEVEGRRVRYSWSEPRGPLFERPSFTVEYPDEPSIVASPARLTEAYFPICLCLSAMGRVRFRLPNAVDPGVLDAWRRVIVSTGAKLFRRTPYPAFETPRGRPAYAAS